VCQRRAAKAKGRGNDCQSTEYAGVIKSSHTPIFHKLCVLNILNGESYVKTIAKINFLQRNPQPGLGASAHNESAPP
jgi:hypothetical protein